MKQATYFDHYRQAREYDGSTVEIGKVGAATLYKATDARSGAPVVLTLLPINEVEESARGPFEEQAKAALQLDHINIVRTVEFGQQGDDYAFISEFPQGETLQTWVKENGPMAPDAVLRVAVQVTSALSAASFHNMVHRGIQPANIVIVSGQTVEGGWPAVKLANFPIAGMTQGDGGLTAEEFASPEQLDQGTVDFRSEIYSLGGTMCFLLTGAFYAAEPRSLQTKRFARPLRRVITPMLRQNPDERPHDPMAVSLELRSCLERVERRQELARRFGIPFVPVATRRVRAAKAHRPQSILAAAIAPRPSVTSESAAMERPRLWPRRALVGGVILLAAATVAAVLLPAPVSMILHRNRSLETIGVPVGVAQTSPQAHPGITQDTATPSEMTVTNRAAAPVPNEPQSNPAGNDSNIAAADQANPSINSPQIVSTESRSPAVSESDDAAVTAASQSPSGPNVVATDPPPPVASVTAVKPAAGSGAPTERSISLAEVAKNGSAKQLSSPAEAPAVAEGDDSSSAKIVSSNRSESTKQAAAAVARLKSSTLDRTRPALTSDRRPSNLQADRATALQPFSAYRSQRARQHSVRAQFVGTTPDGGVVLRLPNGETTVVPPPRGAYVPKNQRRVRRHVIIERGTMVAPPPVYAPYSPED